MNVRNNIITLARGLLCFFVAVILLGFLWAGGTLNAIEYLLWITLGMVFIYSIVITRPGHKKDYRRNNVTIACGTLIFSVLFFLDQLNVIRGPNYVLLIIMTASFWALHYADRQDYK